MVDYEKQFEEASYTATQAKAAVAVFPLVYGWMCAALALSGGVAWYVLASGLWKSIFSVPYMFLGCIIGEIVLVIALSAAIRKIPYAMAVAVFTAYAALNGLTLSVVGLAYEITTIQQAFFVSAGMFGGLALYGTFTKADVSGVGSFCGMALWGLILASVVNLFVGSGALDWVVCVVGVAVFCGLAMWDAQKIRYLAAASAEMDATDVRKAALMGSLELYLDFINLFLYLLRLFGRRR